MASLANYNLWLYYRVGKTNIDADTLLRVSWPRYMSDNSGTHLQVMAAAVWTVQEAALKGATIPKEAYSCDLNILGSGQNSQQVTYMAIERLAPGSAGISNPESSYCKTVGWNPRVMTVETDQSS